jgi:hypothetical protein
MHLADGRSLEVRHPECLARTPNGRTIVVLTPDDKSGEGHMEIVDILLVTSLELLNGQSGRRRRK